MNKKEKLCKDCRHFNDLGNGDGELKEDCTHPNNKWRTAMNLITGDYSEYYRNSPENMRKHNWFDSLIEKACGKRGRWWEHKLTSYDLEELIAPSKR